ncbi:unnamed protein product [Scytosiphon promiscuus]
MSSSYQATSATQCDPDAAAARLRSLCPVSRWGSSILELSTGGVREKLALPSSYPLRNYSRQIKQAAGFGCRRDAVRSHFRQKKQAMWKCVREVCIMSLVTSALGRRSLCPIALACIQVWV